MLAFVGADCPVSNLYLPRLIELEKKYRAQQVQFLAIYPNEGEDLEQAAAHARDRDVPFPVLKDVGQRLADALGVTRVPTVMVLAGKKVSVAETEADGCLLDRGRQATKSDVTYSKHVAPILQRHCQACHRPEQAAPFSLLTYDDAVRHGRMIREVTAQRRMPPWHADPRHGKFSNERRLTADEIDTLTAWVDGGMPRGDDRDLPKPIDFPKGWSLGTPDLVLSGLSQAATFCADSSCGIGS